MDMKMDTEGKTIDGWRLYCETAILAEAQKIRVDQENVWFKAYGAMMPKPSRWKKLKSRIAYRWICLRWDLGSWIAGGGLTRPATGLYF